MEVDQKIKSQDRSWDSSENIPLHIINVVHTTGTTSLLLSSKTNFLHPTRKKLGIKLMWWHWTPQTEGLPFLSLHRKRKRNVMAGKGVVTYLGHWVWDLGTNTGHCALMTSWVARSFTGPDHSTFVASPCFRYHLGCAADTVQSWVTVTVRCVDMWISMIWW